jgi:D-alanyl-D-alanine carboxypeptidase
LLIERASGRTLYEEVARRFLEPLELGGVVPSNGRRVPGLVQGYAGEHDPLGLPDAMLDAEGRFCINPQFEWAGGGFATTARDLARWGRALYAGGALDDETRALMLDAEPAPELGPGVRYGLGAFAWPTEAGLAYGHAGFFPGYLTELRHFPERGVTIALQVNTSDPRALPRSLAELAGELLR